MVDEFLAFSLMASAAAGLAFGLLGFTVWVFVPVVFTMLLGGLVAVWPLSAALWQKFFYVYGPITSLQFGSKSPRKKEPVNRPSERLISPPAPCNSFEGWQAGPERQVPRRPPRGRDGGSPWQNS